jgi:hypothetical protein
MKIVCFALACLVAFSAANEVSMLNDPDTGVATCKEGFYHNGKGFCSPCTKCDTTNTEVSKREYMATDCSEKADRECKKCSEQDTEGGEWRLMSQCSATKDAQFGKCSDCEAGKTEDKPCKGAEDRTCKACSPCNKDANCEAGDTCTGFKKEACSTTEDTQCTQCTQCDTGEYAITKCSEASDRKCKAWTECVAEESFQSNTPSKTEDRECKACTACKTEDGEYVKEKCTQTKDTVCEKYAYAGSGKAFQSKEQAEKKKDDETAFVRCVSDTAGISICSSGCSKDNTGKSNNNKPKENCSEDFIKNLKSWKNGKKTPGQGCRGACKDEDGKVTGAVTFAAAQQICSNLGMRIPKTNEDFARAKGTGCNFNGKKIWYDLN